MSATATTPAGAAPAISGAVTREAHDTAEGLVARARALGPVLREYAEQAERQRRLPRPALEALADAGLQRLFTPGSLGGLEVDPVTCARVVEEVARFDSAAAWALQSVNVNSWWASRFSDRAVEEFFGAGPDARIAAAFHPPQQAREVPGGFRVSGRAPLASTIHDCEWALFSALVFDDDRPRLTEQGPALLVFVLPTADVQIIDTWHSLGMRGTDSNDAAFDGAFVPAHRAALMAPDAEPGRHFRGPLYRFPAVPIIALFGAAVLLATARTALDELRELAQRKTPFGAAKPLRERAVAQAGLAEAEAVLRSARSFFYESLGEAWARTLAGEPHAPEQRAGLMLAGVHAAQSSVRVVDAAHRLAGTAGVYAKSRLERCLRDAHTLRHHGFVAEGRLEAVGQAYFGLPPDFPLLAF
ncbi:MAG TPA: acyl-CoA dehydrogenase family protein [Polyangiaceae bacterium]|nr:acyl-CoA dehydrogenase family protein [Polyangiaceae bacterium]